jgi:putative cardiolipin synthase
MMAAAPFASTQLAHGAAGWRQLIQPLLAALTLALAGCASLPTGVQHNPSQALAPVDSSPLVALARSASAGATLTGVRLLPLGTHSLDARLQLIARATQSLDLQYYVLDNDTSGRLLLGRLADAAARGVRVRLLVDDLYTTQTDALLRAMAALPRVEVRLFNPFAAARDSGLVGRFAASLFDIRRLNHRMHNKLMLADGAWAIAGGRNIADDYFQRGAQHNFIDLDALLTGAVVADLAASFDRYWNSPVVMPIEALSPHGGSAQQLRERFAAQTADALSAAMPDMPETDALGYGPIGAEFDSGRPRLIWGPALMLVDPPDKLDRDADKAWADSLAFQALMKIWTAREEVTITSPYLIPGPLGISAFEALGQRHVKVTVLTNSLAATDEPLVHTGYARYRPQLLAAGVELYELSPSLSQRHARLGLIGSSNGRLHAKTAVVDGDKTFIGSMNLDPRSRTQNTELGIFVESRELAAEMQRVIRISRVQNAYRVRRGADGQLQWVAVDDEEEVVHHSEPESSLWQRLQNSLLSGFVPEQLL